MLPGANDGLSVSQILSLPSWVSGSKKRYVCACVHVCVCVCMHVRVLGAMNGFQVLSCNANFENIQPPTRHGDNGRLIRHQPQTSPSSAILWMPPVATGNTRSAKGSRRERKPIYPTDCTCHWYLTNKNTPNLVSAVELLPGQIISGWLCWLYAPVSVIHFKVGRETCISSLPWTSPFLLIRVLFTGGIHFHEVCCLYTISDHHHTETSDSLSP